jgi:GT2 family glycosyltransferase
VSITLHTSDQPRVSVLILTQKDPGLLRSCLTSLAQHLPPTVPCEVLVLCNGATADVVDVAQREVAGARVFVSPVNLGFGGGNNRLAREARGEYLLLLNDDADVAAGWLEPVVETLDEDAQAAAVGSRILFPDGRVQEAGSVLFDDATTAPVGRGLPPGSAAWTFRRQVDFTSANSLLLRRSAYDDVGGFDEGYFPAYYEDVDLALALRAKGWTWLYDGRSEIRHHESASSVTHFKHFLFDRNVERVREKWGDQLAGQLPRPPGGGPDGPEPSTLRPAIERARGNPPRVLVVDDMLPIPSLGAGFVLMHDLAVQAGLDRYALTVAATKHPGADPRSVARLGYEVVEGDVVEHLGSTTYDLVVVCRPGNYELVEHAVGTSPVLYVAEAVFATRLEREAALLTSERKRKAVLADAAQTRALEERIVRSVQRVAAVSEEEAAVLRGVGGTAPVDVVPPRQPGLHLTEPALESRRDIAYVASWTARGNTPNYDGFWWFEREIRPHVFHMSPWSRLRVTGRNAPTDIAALAGPQLELTGFVPDLAELYAAVRVVIAPIRFGAGVKIKTLEALQYGVPVVTTTIGAEGITVPPDTSPIVVADDPAAFAEAVAQLLMDNETWRARRADIETLHEHWAQQPGRLWPDVLDATLGRATGRTTDVALRT